MNENDAITLLWSFSKEDLETICEALSIVIVGERGDMIKAILSEYSAADISRMGLKNKTKGVSAYTTINSPSNVGKCLTCGK